MSYARTSRTQEHAASQVPASSAAGKLTRSAEALFAQVPASWEELREVLELPAAATVAPQAPESAPESARAPVQRQDTGVADGPGVCLSPEEVRAELVELSEQVRLARGSLEVAALGPALPLDGYPPRFRGIGERLETLRPVVQGCTIATLRAELGGLMQDVQDALLAAFQRLAVVHADRTLQAWSDPNTTDEERQTQRDRWRSEAADPRPEADWCGMFADAQLRAAGFAPEHHMSLNHSVTNVPQFFQYDAASSSGRVMGMIRPFGQGPEAGQVLRSYHEQRGSLRSWKEGTAIGDDLRPGDIVTVDFERDGTASHIAVVRSYTPAAGGRNAVLVTIDGNAYGAQKAGVSSPAFDGTDPMAELGSTPNTRGVSTSRWEVDPAQQQDGAGPTFDRGAMLPDGQGEQNLVIFGRGRPSLVDFELGHEYPDHADNIAVPSTERDAETNPVQRLEQAPAMAGDPGAAFGAAARGSAGEVPYRAEMEARFDTDFSSVRSFTGRDLSPLGASAASRGEEVAFASSSPDRQTVAHELTHVVQTRQGRAPAAAMSAPSDASEHEARQVASSLDHARAPEIGAAPSGVVHRQDDGAIPPPHHQEVAELGEGPGYGLTLNWDDYKGIIGTFELPVGGGGPSSVRVLYNFLLLRNLWAELPAQMILYQLARGPLPSEELSALEGRDVREQAVAGVLGFLTELQRGFVERGNVAFAENVRCALFRANQHAVVEALRVGPGLGEPDDHAYAQRYQQRESGDTFCNVFAFDVVTAMGGYLPRAWYTTESGEFIHHGDAYEEGRVKQVRANDLYDWLVEWGPDYGWQAVTGGPRVAQAQANAGRLVVISGRTVADDAAEVPEGASYTQAPGHISVVLAESRAQGQARPTSTIDGEYVPLQAQAGAQNYSSNGVGSQHGDDSIAYEAWWNRGLFSPQEGKTDANGENHAGHGFFVYTGGAGLGDHSVRPPEETGLVPAT